MTQSKWGKVRLEKICKFAGGTAFKENLQGDRKGDYPFIKVSDMNLPDNATYITSANHWITEKTRSEEKIKVFPKDSVVFAKVGAALLLNRRRILSRDTAIDNNMMAATPTNCHPKYLYYLLQGIDFGKMVQDGAVPSINQSQLDELIISIPDINEQEKISLILSSIDNFIDKLDLKFNKLKNLKNASINKYTTKGLVDHKIFKQSICGEIPSEWKLVSLKDLGKCVRGLTYSPDDISERGLLVLRSSNIQDGDLCFEDCVYVDKELQGEYLTQKNDILICVRNGSRNLIGKNVLIQDPPKNATHGAFMTVFRGNDNEYVQYLMQSNLFFKQVSLDLGATINSINNSNLVEYKFPFPPKEERDEIVKILGTIDQNISEVKKQITKVKHLKAGLMQDLLTGKVRVPVN